MIIEGAERGKLTGLMSVSYRQAAMSIMAGAIWQVGNVLLALTIQIAGPGFAMCCCGSLGMTLGTGLTYCISPEGSMPILFSGIALALSAAAVTLQMHRVKNLAFIQYNRAMVATLSGSRDVQIAPQQKAGLRLTFLLGIGAGLAVGLFYPLNTIALARPDRRGHTISVNASMLWFGFGVFLGAQLCLPALRKLLPCQFEDEILEEDTHAACRENCHSSWWTKLQQEASMTSIRASCLSMLAGIIWSVGFLTNLKCGSSSGYAVAFGLSQTCPLIATFWGLLIFQEWSGPWIPMKAKVLLVMDMLLYLGAVSCLVLVK